MIRHLQAPLDFGWICSNGKICAFSVNLRLQVNPENSKDFHNIAPQRAFADFLFAHVVLHLVVMNFIG